MISRGVAGLLLGLVLFRTTAFADPCQVVCRNIEAELGETLPENTRSAFNGIITLVRDQDSFPPSQELCTKILICLGVSYDTVYVGGHPFICSDLSGHRYGGFGIGVGFGAGLSGDVFALIGRVLPEKGIGGIFSGGHLSGALGWYGGGVGLFYRNKESGVTPDPKSPEKLYWIGYEAGFDIDFSAMELAISEL